MDSDFNIFADNFLLPLHGVCNDLYGGRYALWGQRYFSRSHHN